MLVLWFISGMFFPDAFEYTVYLGWFLPFYVIKINLLQHSQVHAFSQQMWPSASHGPHLSHSALPLMKPSPACSVWVYDLTAAHFTLILLIRYLFLAFITPSILRYLSWASWMSRFPASSMSTDGKVGAQQVRKCCLFPTLSMKSHSSKPEIFRDKYFIFSLQALNNTHGFPVVAFWHQHVASLQIAPCGAPVFKVALTP